MSRQYLVVSGLCLKVLAAVFWYFGGIILSLKGGSLLLEAKSIKPELGWLWQIVALAMILGGLKARYIFSKSCQKNLDRIAGLTRPRIWQFFSLRFFLALTLMILAGSTLSYMAHDNFPMLIAVAFIDISIAMALLVSSYKYWKR